VEQDRTPYLDALAAHADAEPLRAYVPGHKGGLGADPALREALGERALRLDIPALIPGIDVGPVERNYFEQAQRLAADAWGAARSWFLVGGASQANHVACMVMRHYGKGVVLQRNVHSSAIDGSILAGLEPAFAAPEIDPERGIAHCLTPEALARALDSKPDAVGALCVSPTYFGACADVAALAQVAHERGVPLIVDEAWGAHLHFSDELPASAIDSGADLVISSTHKMGGSLTQSAMIHLAHGARIDADLVDRVVTLLETTSPSSILSMSLDAARRRAAVHGRKLLERTLAALREAHAALRAVPGLDVLDPTHAGVPGVAGWDPLRLVVDVRGTGISGHRFAQLLREEENAYVELATESVVVGAFGLGGDAVELAPRFAAACERVARGARVEGERPHVPFAIPPRWGPLELTPRDAFLGPQEAVELDAAEGRIAAESLAAYPPGIPNVLPGERLTAETLGFIRRTLAEGGFVRGPVDRSLHTIRVVRE
jgi:arginine/lysine/ornithine decarboxylase